MVERIILANPRGFCAGVERAIDVVEKSLEIYGKPIYVRHHIVHNEHVVKDLEQKGAIFVEELKEIPDDAKVIFSAHGTPPRVIDEAKNRGLFFIDAVCPLVIKIHFEAKRFHKEGYDIILVGHAGHQEVEGTMGNAPMHLIESEEDVEKLELSSEKIAVLTQTTLSVDETAGILRKLKEKFPQIKMPHKEDICYATTNRQSAVKEMAKEAELIIVLGSKTSSNSVRLMETARRLGIDSYLIDDKSELQKKWYDQRNTIGITSGASAPDKLVQEVIEQIQSEVGGTVEVLTTVKEDMHFSPPKELRVIT